MIVVFFCPPVVVVGIVVSENIIFKIINKNIYIIPRAHKTSVLHHQSIGRRSIFLDGDVDAMSGVVVVVVFAIKMTGQTYT